MKKLASFAVPLLLGYGVAPASAADLARAYTKAPPPVIATVYDWSGFYIGANGGWATSAKCWDLVGFAGTRFAAIADGCPNPSGAVAGGQIGYNWQIGQFVMGLEAQGDWAGLRGSVDPASFPGTTNRAEVDSFGFLSGRLGYAFNTALLYVKGGAAVVHDRYSYGLTGAAVPTATASETRWGANVGAGFEYGFAPGWSAAIDYQHAFLGRRDVTFTDTVVENIRQDMDIFTARLNYRFGWR